MSAALTATDIVLAREQKLHALDGLAAAAAHELGTPLSTIVLVTKEMEHAAKPDSPCTRTSRCCRPRLALPRDPAKADPHPGEEDPMHARVSVRVCSRRRRSPTVRTRSPSTSRLHRRPRRRGQPPPGRGERRPGSSTGSAISSRTPPIRAIAGGCEGGMERRRPRRLGHRRWPRVPSRGDGQYRRALRHDAPRRQRERAGRGCHRVWASVSSSPRR